MFQYLTRSAPALAGRRSLQNQNGFVSLFAQNCSAFKNFSTETVAPADAAPRLTVEDLQGRKFVPRKALEVLRKVSEKRNFDESFEIQVELNLDVRKADQTIRTNVTLPHSHGKERTRVIALVPDESASKAREAGAQVAGLDNIIQRIRSKKLRLEKTDKVLATPDSVKKVQKEIAKILGPKGLMPNAKLGTVVDDIEAAVDVFKNRNVSMRTAKHPLLHAGIGKMSFSDDILLENFKAFMLAVRDNKPAGAKGKYITRVCIKGTMSPAVDVDIQYADPSSAFFMRDEKIKTA